MATVNDALDLELVEHLLLVGVRTHLEARECQSHPVVKPLSGCLGERIVELVAVGVGVIALECRVAPMAVEGGEELLQQRRCGDRGQSHVPLEAIEHCCSGEVAGTDVCSVEAGVAPEEPGLRVQSCPLCVVLDLDLRPKIAHQSIEGSPLGGTHVRRGEDTEGDAAFAQRFQLVIEQAQTVPLDEGHDDVDAVRTRQLSAELMADTRLTRSIGEQSRIREWRRRALTEHPARNPGSRWHRNREELPSSGDRIPSSP